MTNRTRNGIGALFLALGLFAGLNKLTGARSYGVWTSPSGEWSAEVLYKRSRLLFGPTSVSVRIVCVAENLIMRAKFLGVVDRPAVIDAPPGFVAIDSPGFTIGPGSLYGSDLEAFVFAPPDCRNARRFGG